MTDEDKKRLEEIREREKKATRGPWDAHAASDEWLENGPANAEFCRHARTDIPYLLDLVERLENSEEEYKRAYHKTMQQWDKDISENARLREALENIRQHCRQSIGTRRSENFGPALACEVLLLSDEGALKGDNKNGTKRSS